MKRLLSTGAVTRAPDCTDHAEILERLPALGPREYELSFYPQWYERLDAVRSDLDGSGLRFPVYHVDKELGGQLPGPTADAALSRFAENCGFAREVGAEILVFHLWELPVGDRRLEENLARLPDCLDAADASGLTLAVETIPCTLGSPLDNVLRACDRDPRCRVVLDTEFLALHGQLDEALEFDISMVAHVHVKDFDGSLRDAGGHRRYLLPGEGSLDLDRFLEVLATRGYRGAATLEMSALTPAAEFDSARLEAALAWVNDGREP